MPRFIDALPPPPSSRPPRDPRIDFWRGLCLLGMAVWHLLSDPAFPYGLSFPVIQGFNFVAEGFVLLAGLCAGLGAAGPGPLRSARYLRRAAALLAVHYACVAALLAVFAVPYRPEAFVQAGPAGRAAAVLTLSYQPYLGDILSVFVFLFLATPVLLALRRAWGDAAMLGASAALYAGTIATGFLAPEWGRALEVNRARAFDFNTWLLVYAAGIAAGARYTSVTAELQHRFWTWLAAVAAALGAAAAAYLAVKSGAGLGASAKALLVERHPLGPVRVAYVALQMLLIALVTLRLWDRFARTWAVHALAALGRHSLTVFLASVFLDYTLKAAIERWALTFPANLATLAVELGLMYLLARWLDRPPPGRPVTGEASNRP